MSRAKPRREPGSRRASRRLALKIAARTSARSLGRSALIAVMVALPVAGLTSIAIVFDSGRPTAQERIITELGRTEAQLLVVSTPSPDLVQVPTSHSYEDPTPSYGEFADLAEVLPSGTRILALSTGSVTATTATGSASFDVREGPSWDPSFAGKYDVTAGRTPRNDREVMVTAALLPRLGVALGGTVELRPPAPHTVTIVGVLDDSSIADSEQWFFARAGALSMPIAENPELAEYYLPDTVLDWDAVRDLNKQGITAVSRAVLLDPPPPSEGAEQQDNGSLLAIVSMAAVVAGFAAFEVILLAGAAFTVTARQQQRTLATIASVGAPRRLLFRVLSANGIVLGAIGGVLGVAVGIGAAAAFMAVTANGSATRYFGFHLPWLALLGFAIFAVVIGWIASLVPARAASRFDIVAALRGARKPPAPSTRRPVIGLVMLLVGIGIAIAGGILMAVLLEAGRGLPGGHPLLWLPVLLLIVGPVLAQIGLVLCGPLALRVIARLAQRSGIGARLASRDAARNPSRAVPALAAIMTTVFVTTVAMCMISAGQENSRLEHQYHYALGQVAVPLTSFEFDRESGDMTLSDYDNTDAIIDALKSTVDVASVGIIAGVPDPTDLVEGNGGADGIAVPIVPPRNLCPASPGSPTHSDEVDLPGTPEYLAMLTDWRCQGAYPAMTGLTSAHIHVGDADDLALVLGRQPSAGALRALAEGGAVSLYPEYVENGRFIIQWWPAEQATMATYGGQSGTAIREESLAAVVELPEHPISFGVFVSPATANRLGLVYTPMTLLASTVEPPNVAQRDALEAAMLGLPGNANGNIHAELELGPPQYASDWSWGLLALAALISLASAAVAIGLARFDGRQDDATLSSLGAGQRVRRAFAFWQALIICGVGAVLGAAIGLVPAFALSANPSWPFMPPWLQIGISVLALPLAIAVGSWLVAARNRVSARRIAIA